MTKLREVCRHVRSKNAGPFWVTIDICFDGPESYMRYRDSGALSSSTLARVLGTSEEHIKLFQIDNLNVVKVSYPRRTPQGGVVERDMHSGQQYVRLLEMDID